MLQNYQENCQVDRDAVKKTLRWSPPPIAYLKVNTDAAMHGNHLWRFGVAVRNWKGELIVAAARAEYKVDSPAVAECLALRWAMELIGDLEHRRILMETDCFQAVKEFKDPNPLSSLFGLLEDVREMASTFDDFKLVFSPRSCNELAHNIARNFSTVEATVWKIHFPFCISELAFKDVSNSSNQ